MISRYQSDEMESIWSDQNKFDTWLLVEIYTVKALGKLGKIPNEDIIKIENNATFNIKRIFELEKELKHDVVAFTRTVSESLGEEKKWIHYGLTSTDVVDTSLGYILKQSNDLIEEKIMVVIETLKKMAIKHKYSVQMGRTHGVHAELTTFGYKMAIYYEEMLRNKERFDLARKQIEIGKISGAVGTYANVELEVQDFVCKELKINSSNISTQTLQRDRHAFYVSTIAIIGSTIDKIATELRHLQRTEVQEVMEGFSKNQKGSSAMPHKKNPISSENLSGLSRVLRGYSVAALEDVALWHERDISHSSCERIILPDVTSLIEYMLNRLNNVLKNLYINTEQMLENINCTNNVFFSQKILLTLINNGLNREEAYDLVQPIALDCFNNKKDFKVEMFNVIDNMMTKEEYESCFDINYHFSNIDKVFQKIFNGNKNEFK